MHYKEENLVENWELLLIEILYMYNKTEGGYYGLEEYDSIQWLNSFGDFEFISSDDNWDGDNIHDQTVIFKWKGQCYRFQFNYLSHAGYDLESATVYKVTPEEKLVTDFIDVA